MEKYTELEQRAIGNEIAEMLMMKRSSIDRSCFQTTRGTKSGTGIFSMILELADKINNDKKFWETRQRKSRPGTEYTEIAKGKT